MDEVRADRRPSDGGNRRRRGGVRIDEVAALAGVSIATVSRALAHPDRVNAATRERVLEAVRRTGYMPNVAARSLRAARSMMVLVVIPSLITPFFSNLLLGIDQALSAHGYGLLVGNLDDLPGKEARLVGLVAAGQVDGVVLLDGRVLHGPTRSLTDLGVPIVGVSVPVGPGVPVVLVDERGAAAAVARHLIGLGHRRLAYLSGVPGHYVDDERWAGFRDAAAAAGLDPAAILHLVGDFHAPSGAAAGRRLLELSAASRPTALFAASDMMAIGLMREVRAAGWRVPEDLSVVGFDGIELADYYDPMLTTARQPREAMGRIAVDLLMRLMAGEAIAAADAAPRLAAPLRVGRSSAAPPGGPR